MQKRGMELAVSTIVIIILSILIFIGGIALTWKLFAGAEELKTGIEQKTKQQIEAMLRQGTDLVAIPINSQRVDIGKDAVFGLGIRNIKQEPDFTIVLGLSGMYDAGQRTLTQADKPYIEERWLGNFKTQSSAIDKNAFGIVPLSIRAASTIDAGIPTPKGALAVFNVCVFHGTEQIADECADDVPKEFLYDGRLRQISVEIR